MAMMMYEDDESWLPMWKGMSFPAWSEKMETLIKETGKWEVIARGKEKTRKSITDDTIVFNWLSASLDEEDWAWLSAKTAKEVWERIHSRFGMNLEEDEVEDEVLMKTEMHNDEESTVTSSQIGRGLPCKDDELSFAKTTMMMKKTHEDVQCQRDDQGVNLRSLEKAEDEETEISHQEENLPKRGKMDEQEEFLSSNEGMFLTCFCNEELVKEREELREKEEKMLEWQETTEACDQALKKYEEEECKGTDVYEEVEVESSEREELPSCVYEKSSSVDDLCMMKMKPDDHKETIESHSFEKAKDEKAKVAVMKKEGDPPLRGADVMTPYDDGSEKSFEEEISFHCHGDMADDEEEKEKRKEEKEKRKNEREEKEKRKMKKRWPMSHKPVLANNCLMSAGFMNFIPHRRNEKMKKKDDRKEDMQERKKKNVKMRSIWQMKDMMNEPPWKVLFRTYGEGMKKNIFCIYPILSEVMMKRKVSSSLAISARHNLKNEDEDTAFEVQMSKWQTSHIDEEERSPKKKIAEETARMKIKMKKIRRRKKKRKWSTLLYPCSKKKKKKGKKKKIKKLMEELKDEEDNEDDDLQMLAAVSKMRGLLGKVKMKS